MNLVLKFTYFNCQSNQAEADTFQNVLLIVLMTWLWLQAFNSLETNGVEICKNDKDPRLFVHEITLRVIKLSVAYKIEFP